MFWRYLGRSPWKYLVDADELCSLPEFMRWRKSHSEFSLTTYSVEVEGRLLSALEYLSRTATSEFISRFLQLRGATATAFGELPLRDQAEFVSSLRQRKMGARLIGLALESSSNKESVVNVVMELVPACWDTVGDVAEDVAWLSNYPPTVLGTRFFALCVQFHQRDPGAHGAVVVELMRATGLLFATVVGASRAHLGFDVPFFYFIAQRELAALSGRLPVDALTRSTRCGSNALCFAIESADSSVVQRLVHIGAKFPTRFVGSFAEVMKLVWSAADASLEIDMLLRDSAAVDWNAITIDGSPLGFAVVRHHRANRSYRTVLGWFKRLYKHGYNMNIVHLGCPLVLHVMGQYHVRPHTFLDFFESCGADLHTRNSDGEGVLHVMPLVSRESGERLARLCLDVDLEDHAGNTPLLTHARSPRTVRWLLQAKANVAHRNNRGDSALARALQARSFVSSILLRRRMLDEGCPCDSGDTRHASETPDDAMQRFILGADQTQPYGGAAGLVHYIVDHEQFAHGLELRDYIDIVLSRLTDLRHYDNGASVLTKLVLRCAAVTDAVPRAPLLQVAAAIAASPGLSFDAREGGSQSLLSTAISLRAHTDAPSLLEALAEHMICHGQRLDDGAPRPELWQLWQHPFGDARQLPGDRLAQNVRARRALVSLGANPNDAYDDVYSGLIAYRGSLSRLQSWVTTLLSCGFDFSECVAHATGTTCPSPVLTNALCTVAEVAVFAAADFYLYVLPHPAAPPANNAIEHRFPGVRKDFVDKALRENEVQCASLHPVGLAMLSRCDADGAATTLDSFVRRTLLVQDTKDDAAPATEPPTIAVTCSAEVLGALSRQLDSSTDSAVHWRFYRAVGPAAWASGAP